MILDWLVGFRTQILYTYVTHVYYCCLSNRLCLYRVFLVIWLSNRAFSDCESFHSMSDHVLVIGGGGREHCLAWRLAESQHLEKVYVAPGNGGTSIENKSCNGKIENVTSLNLTDHASVKHLCSKNKIDLVVVGPEAPLADGLVDFLTAEGIPCFGPTKEAARIETSKAFAKEFMAKYNIPTARWKAFKDSDQACEHIRAAKYPALVVKANGLTAGKGVIVAETMEEAEKAVKDFLLVGWM